MHKTTKNGLFSFQNLLKAYEDCRKNKSNTHSAAEFEKEREKNLFQLARDLQNKTYKPSKSICFAVTKPVPREIFAASFCDRVIHHLFYNHTSEKFEKIFIDQSCACRKEKGTHYAFKYLKKYIKKITKNGKETAFFIHLDIRSFFMSIDKKILIEQIRRKLKNKDLIWLAEVIILSDPTKNYFCKSPPKLMSLIPKHKSLFGVPAGKGLPIGNLTSQFFANIYLNDLDRFVKHKIKAKYYLRYVDDFVLLNKDENILKKWEAEIEIFLKETLKLELNKQKRVLNKIENGIDWIGYIVKPKCSLVRKRTVKTCKNRLYFYRKNLEEKTILDENDGKNVISVVNSYFGHFHHANSFKLRKHLYENHFGRIKEILEKTGENLISFSIKEKNRKPKQRR